MVFWSNSLNKELLTLRNHFVVTKKFLKAKFDCTSVTKFWLKRTLSSLNTHSYIKRFLVVFMSKTNTKLIFWTLHCSDLKKKREDGWKQQKINTYSKKMALYSKTRKQLKGKLFYRKLVKRSLNSIEWDIFNTTIFLTEETKVIPRLRSDR